ncbi:carbohydrate-binding protein (plasmid) [Bacillus sp. F19]|nr:carbohydrate-binding protein [Bacillus sp. F19]
MLFLKRLKILTLTMIAILVGLSAVPFQGKSYAEGTENTTEEPIFSFMSMSDTHSDTGKTAKAVTDAKNNNASAIVLVGDITNLGDSGEYDAIRNAIDSVKDHPPVHYTMGNHEYDWQSDYNVAKNRFIEKAEIPEKKVYYHREIQGYDFLFLGFDKKPDNISYMSDEQLAWLESTLAENAEPDKPIFVFTHNPIYQTVSKSYSDNYYPNTVQEQKFRNILEKYPQAILTTGHLHDDTKIQGNMYTNRFTALRDGAVLNSQAMMFDVYKDKVHIKGRDVTTQKTIWEGTMSLHPNTTGMYEAEDSVFAYATSGDDINLSGGKYVNMNHGSAYIESLKVDGASGGNKILKIRYATDAANVTKGLYVNGAKVQTLSFPTTGSTSSYNELAVPVELNQGPNNKIVIKSDGNAAGVNIDKFQIMDSNDPSTMWGYNGNGNDSIKNGFNATLHGSAAYDTTDKMEGSASLSLNGADGNYASADLVSTKTNNVTLTAWVKWNGATSGSQQILSNGDGRTNGYSIVLDHDQGDKVSIAVNGQTILGSQTALTPGQWTNITAARKSGTWKLYINGNSVPVTDNNTTPATPTTGTYIGADSRGQQSFNGRIDAVRVYNQALSTDQIMAIANETSNVKLQSIEITKLPKKLNYLRGEQYLNLEGLVVAGTYSDGTTKVENVKADHITGFDSTTLKKELPITVTLGGKTASFNVNILDVMPGSALVPGRIEGANYNSKRPGSILNSAPTNDGDPAWVVGALEKGDWMEYHVDVAKSGFYQLNYKVASGIQTGEIEFQVDGVPQTRTSFSTGGWNRYVIKSETVALSEGSHKIRLNVNAAYWLLRWFELIEVQEKKLNSITAPADITDVAIGSAKTAAALGLPAKVALVTDGGNVDASVNWDVNSASYDPTATTVQTFTVTGKVTLPIGVTNPNSVPLTTSIRVTVNKIPAWNATVTSSSSFNASYTPDKVFDGIGQAVNGEWASKGEQNPWIQVNWTTNQTFNKIIFYDRPNLADWASGGTLTFSDGSTLTVSGIPNDGSAYSVTFPDKTVTWVKFQVSGGSGPNVGLSEMKILAPVDK